MSETAHHPAPSDTPLFSAVEIEQFDADDVAAGSAIGKMLSLLFLYTVLAMGLVSWWTFSVARQSAADATPATEHSAH